MDFKHKAEKLTVGALYYILETIRVLLGRNEVDPVLSKVVLPDKSKEPNYVYHEEEVNGVKTKFMTIKDPMYETYRDIVKRTGQLFQIDLEKAGESLDYFLTFFKSYDLKTLRKNEFKKPISKDSNCVYFKKYKDTWLGWIDNFANRMLADPLGMKIEIDKYAKDSILFLNYWQAELQINKIKDFLTEVLNG